MKTVETDITSSQSFVFLDGFEQLTSRFRRNFQNRKKQVTACPVNHAWCKPLKNGRNLGRKKQERLNAPKLAKIRVQVLVKTGQNRNEAMTQKFEQGRQIGYHKQEETGHEFDSSHFKFV